MRYCTVRSYYAYLCPDDSLGPAVSAFLGVGRYDFRGVSAPSSTASVSSHDDDDALSMEPPLPSRRRRSSVVELSGRRRRLSFIGHRSGVDVGGVDNNNNNSGGGGVGASALLAGLHTVVQSAVS